MPRKRILRKVAKQKGREWVDCKMHQVKKGDKFRMWEVDDTIIRVDNKYVFVAAGDAYEHPEHGRWTVDIE